MSLSKILTVLTALSCLVVFGSLGGGFQNAILGLSNASGSTVGSAASAAEGDGATGALPGLPDVGATNASAGSATGAPAGGDASGFGDVGASVDGLGGDSSGVQAATPQLGESGPVDGQGVNALGADGTGAANAEGGLQPGRQAQMQNPSDQRSIVESLTSERLKDFFTWDNLKGALIPVAAIAGGFAIKALGAALAGVATVGVAGFLATVGGGVVAAIGATAIIVGVVGLVAYGGYKAIQFLTETMEDTQVPNQGGPGASAGAPEAPGSSLPSEQDLADALDSDGDGVSLEDEIAAEEGSEGPSEDIEIPNLDGSDSESEPEFAAPTSAAGKFAVSLLGDDASKSRDMFQDLLIASASKTDAQIEAQAKDILGELAKRGYTGNELVKQWTEEAIIMGYDPRLPLALLSLTRSGQYAAEVAAVTDNALLNDFSGAWNALSDDGELYDVIDQLGTCGGGSSCAASMTSTGHSFVSGSSPRLSANPNANANTMTAKLIEAIEIYLADDAIAEHTKESIRPLLDAYAR